MVVVVFVLFKGEVVNLVLEMVSICYSFVMLGEVMYIVIVYCYDVVEKMMRFVFGVVSLFVVVSVWEVGLVRVWVDEFWVDSLGG